MRSRPPCVAAGPRHGRSSKLIDRGPGGAGRGFGLLAEIFVSAANRVGDFRRIDQRLWMGMVIDNREGSVGNFRHIHPRMGGSLIPSLAHAPPPIPRSIS
jgi:hypothetical protein